MNKIQKVTELPNFEGWPNNARAKIIDKFNELIEVINQQQEDIKTLKRNEQTRETDT